MQIIKVSSKNDWKLFHKIPHLIYGKDPNWICPLRSDVQNIFDPSFNKYLRTGLAEPFVLLDDQQQPVGRIAIIIDHARNEKQGTQAGGIGYFECVDNPDYAKMLFDHAEAALIQRQINIIDAPISLGERDRFWGLLDEGFGKEPYYQENYHPKYYRSFFEAAGFQKFEQILTLTTYRDDVPIDRFRKVSKRVLSRYDYKVVKLDLKKVDKFAADAATVYNEAFKHIAFFQPITGEQVLQMFETIKPIIDPKMICFTYFEGEPVGFGALAPEINEFFKGFKGKVNKLKLMRFFWRFRTKKVKSMKGIAFGIHPDHQSKGVYAVMVDALFSPHFEKNYDKVCIPTIRGHNNAMVKTTTQLGAKPDRIHYTYRKILDPNIPFEAFEFYNPDE